MDWIRSSMTTSPKKKSAKPKSGPKSTNRRARTKYSALKPGYNLKTRTDEISDIQSYASSIPDDLIDKKTGKPVKEWLNSFVEEHINANFKHQGIKLMKKKNEKRERYRANNSRNKDIYTREKAQGKLNYIEDIKDLGKDNVADDFDLEMSPDHNGDFYFWKENEED